MNPDSSEIFGLTPNVYLLVEVISNSLVVEGDRYGGTLLFDELHVFNEQQFVGGRDAESADLGVTIVTKIKQLRPGIRCEPECRPPSLNSSRPLLLSQSIWGTFHR